MTLTHGHRHSTTARLVRALLLVLSVALALASLLCACSERRAQPSPAPVYRNDIARLLAARCASCHAGEGEAAEVPLDSYPSLLACSADAGGAPDGSRRDAGRSEPGSVLLAALERADHAEVLTEAERARLIAWFAADAPLRAHGSHPPGILNPRSPDWHGRLAAVDRFAPLRDPARADACGRCHDGAPVRPREVRVAAPGAPACSQCHLEAAERSPAARATAMARAARRPRAIAARSTARARMPTAPTSRHRASAAPRSTAPPVTPRPTPTSAAGTRTASSTSCSIARAPERTRVSTSTAGAARSRVTPAAVRAPSRACTRPARSAVGTVTGRHPQTTSPALVTAATSSPTQAAARCARPHCT